MVYVRFITPKYFFKKKVYQKYFFRKKVWQKILSFLEKKWQHTEGGCNDWVVVDKNTFLEKKYDKNTFLEKKYVKKFYLF